MRRLESIVVMEAGLAVVTGVILCDAIARAIRANVYAMSREVIYARAFHGAIMTAFGLATLFILRGISSVRYRRVRSIGFAAVEGPLAIVVGFSLISIAGQWRIIGDVSLPGAIEASEQLPLALALVVNPVLFYCLFIPLVCVALWLFLRELYRVQ